MSFLTFPVSGNYQSLAPGGVIKGTVKFTPNVLPGIPPHGVTGGVTYGMLTESVFANINNGILTPFSSFATTVTLTSNDPTLNLTGNLQYTVTFINVTVDGCPLTVNPFTFNAPADSTPVNLVTVSPGTALQIVSSLPTLPVSGLSDATTFSKGFLTGPTDQASARTYLGISGANEWEQYANLAAFPVTGNTLLEYVAQDTEKLYRWNGSTYIQVSDKNAVGLGNVDNTSDITKNAATVALTNKDLTAASNTFPTSITGLPSYVITRNRPHSYDAPRNVYNRTATNTRRLRASLGLAAAGSLAHHLFIGDSLTAGYMGSASSPAWDPLHAWPRIYRSTLVTLGIPVGGTGFVPISDQSQLAADPRWTLSSGWAASGLGYAGVAASGKTATFLSDTAGTQVDVYYFTGGGAFTVAIDGGGAVTVTPAGGGPTAAKYTVTGLSNIAHSVVITTTTATTLYMLGASVTAASGLVCHNIALGSSQTSTWSTTSAGTVNAARVGSLTASGITPSVVFIELGINDVLNSIAVGTTIANLTTLAGQFPTSDILLFGAPDWNNDASQMYDLADTLNVPFVDLFDRYGGTANGSPAQVNGLVTDAAFIHPNQAAHADWGRSIAMLAAS